nr:retrotransposon protein, putative, Ty1-copia subclass [Tanacetum cinerariifolium]
GRIQKANKKSQKAKGKGKMTRKSFPHHPERATGLLGLIHTDVCRPLRHVSRQENQLGKTIKALRSDRGESAACILNMVSTKKVDKTPYELWYGKVPNLSYLKEAGELEEIQDEDTSPSENTSKIPMEVKGFKPPHKEEALVCRSERTHRAPERCLNVEAEEHSLGDLNEPANYKATVKSNWLFKKKTNMDGIIHTYKSRLVVNGFTQLYLFDYEEMFSSVADIRAIRILIAIAVFYDYEIWKMYVKTAFLNGYLDEDIYMVQPEGFVDLKYPWKVHKLQRSIYGLKQASRSWNKKIDEERKRFDLNNTQGASTPGKVKRMQNVPYASAVGEPHWTAVKTILMYLKNTKDMFLVYGGNPKAELRVDCYCDVGFETNRDDTKSQTGYVWKT